MRILDRYLLMQFIQVYFICFLSLVGLYVVFDMFAHLDEFMKFADSTFGLLAILGEYYSYRMLYMFQKISGIVALIAAMFTLTWIQAHNELVAILAAGVPTRRVLLPVVLGTIFVAGASVAVREYAIPRFKEELSRTPRDLKGQSAQQISPRYDYETDVLLQGSQSVAGERKVLKPNFILPSSIAGRSTVLIAKEAFYQEATADRPSGYLLRSVTDPVGFCQRKSLVLQQPEGLRQVVLTPADHPWLQPDECFLSSRVTFEQWAGGEDWQQFSSTGELITDLHNPSLDYGGSVRVAVHARIVQPLLDVSLLLLGLPFAVNLGNRNLFVSIGICMAISTVFLIVTIACNWLGSVSLLSAALGAWLPVIVFAPASIWMSYRVWR